MNHKGTGSTPSKNLEIANRHVLLFALQPQTGGQRLWRTLSHHVVWMPQHEGDDSLS